MSSVSSGSNAIATSIVNCWEFTNCGHGPGADARGGDICPAAASGEYDGKNNGTFAGRICWRVEGTLCSGEPEKNLAIKMTHCLRCPFFKNVRQGEGKRLQG